MLAAAAASSTVGVCPSVTNMRALSINASRVLRFWSTRPVWS
jgi:hypothetical protein